MNTLSSKLLEENEFVQLKDFEDRYEIMKSFPYEIYDMKLNTFNFGSRFPKVGNRVGLFKNDKSEVWCKHRLIMKQFNPEYNEHKHIFHINGNKLDNHIENLSFRMSDMKK